MSVADDIIAQLQRGACSDRKRHDTPCATCDAVDARIAWVRRVDAASLALRHVSIEAHHPGEAVYVGRDEHHHGYNIALVTEADPAYWPRVRDAITTLAEDPALLSREPARVQ